MTLVIVKAEEVREGEPRCWYTTEMAATRAIPHVSIGDLHGKAQPAGASRAIVDRPVPPRPDADERAFWCAVYEGTNRALLSQPISLTPDAFRAIGVNATAIADAALAEYRKRFGGAQ